MENSSLTTTGHEEAAQETHQRNNQKNETEKHYPQLFSCKRNNKNRRT